MAEQTVVDVVSKHDGATAIDGGVAGKSQIGEITNSAIDDGPIVSDRRRDRDETLVVI